MLQRKIKKILIGTNNKGKLKEIRDLLPKYIKTISTSEFKLIKRGRNFSSINFFPKTGRTHQIRVHCSELGHPIIGDELYGGGWKKLNEYLPEVKRKIKERIDIQIGHYLHASKISFMHPKSGKKVVFKAEPNESFLNLLNTINNEEV